MKVFAISDLHLSINNPKPMDIFGEVWNDYFDKITDSWQKKVSSDDVVLICGDISWAMSLNDAVADLKLLSNLNGKKIIIRGNHDYWWKSISALRSILSGISTDFFALQNDCIRIGGVIFCGSRGWGVECETPDDKKIFDRELIRMRMSLESMTKLRQENDKIVVLTHYPPFNYKAESSSMTQLFEEFAVDKVVYGHLHGKSVRAIGRLNKNNIEYILSSCDQIDNELIQIL